MHREGGDRKDDRDNRIFEADNDLLGRLSRF